MDNLTGRFIIPFLRLIRWPNILIIILTQFLVMFAIIGRIYARSGTAPAMDIFLFSGLVFTTVLIAMAGYIINDLFDIRTDRINKPDALIVGKYLKGRKVVRLYYLLNGLAIVIGFLLSWKVGSYRLGLVFPMMILLLWFYSERFKQTILAGNLIVSFMTASVVLIVWLFEFFALRLQPDKFITVYTQLTVINRILPAFALFAFLLTMVRELIKDAEDVEGDATTGCSTLPVKYGVKFSKILAVVFLVLTLVLVVLSCLKLASMAMQAVLVYFAIIIGVPVVFLIYKVIRTESKSDFHRISGMLKLVMLLGLSGMLLLAFYL
ncbi:MAG: UbiA family prenyltransferase [Lentimicrobium sp.]|nr:UbiA family prenyltransferase [Lentimicrobium sp.]